MKSAATAEQFVYPQRTVAALIAERMTQIKGSKYDVVQIPQGFQVVPIQTNDGHVITSKPQPTDFKLPSLLKDGEVEFSFQLVGEGITYITVMHEGKQKAFGKSTLLGWDKDVLTNTIVLKMTVAIAKKRGLLP